MPSAETKEKRLQPRQAMTRQVRLRDRRSQRPRPAILRDLSDGGALLEIRGLEYLSVGDRIEVAADFQTDHVRLARGRVAPAVVVRRCGTEVTPMIGLKFTTPARLNWNLPTR